MQKPKHLQIFTSIISMMKVKSPEMGEELDCLRAAVTQWYNGMQIQILNKNRAIMAAKTRGTEKLLHLLNQMENFFRNVIKYYSDPNLPIFFRIFLKIKEQFQFVDLDFDKFYNKTRENEAQTDRQSIYHYGIDMDKFMKSIEKKQIQIQQANDKIVQIEGCNNKLKTHIQRLQQQLQNMEKQHQNHANQLKKDIENKKREIQNLQSRKETERKKTMAYRSNPELLNYDGLQNKKFLVNMLNNAFDQLETEQNQHNTSIQEIAENKDSQLLRMLFCQATSIQAFIYSKQAYEKQYE